MRAAAASHLSKTEGGLTPSTSVDERKIVDLRSVFTDNAKITQYFESGSPEEGIDDAILIEDEAQCFVAFQSTTGDIQDILQNANFLNETLCRNDNQDECCEFHKGFANGWK